MSITDELRTGGIYRFPSNRRVFTEEELTAIADRIDAEHEAKVSYWQGASYKDGYDDGFASADDWLGQHEDAMAEHGWVKLPVDADGEVWHVGDFVVGEVNPRNPKAIERMLWYGPDSGWQLETDTIIYPCPDRPRHHHEPTVEDVLREFAEKIIDSQIPNVHPTYEEAIAEYAAKLRLADDGKEQ